MKRYIIYNKELNGYLNKSGSYFNSICNRTRLFNTKKEANQYLKDNPSHSFPDSPYYGKENREIQEYKKESKFHLTLMSYDEAVDFVKKNAVSTAIIYNDTIGAMTLCNLENTPEGLVGTCCTDKGITSYYINTIIHDIYMIVEEEK